MTFTIGTPGAAIAISSAALFFSIFLPLYLERRREKREDRSTLDQSWVRLVQATAHLDSDPHNPVESIQQWLNLVYVESLTIGGCLPAGSGAAETLNRLQELVYDHRGMLRNPGIPDAERRQADIDFRREAMQAMNEINAIATKQAYNL